MKVCFVQSSWAQYQEWVETDPETARRINALIGACMREPFKGLGKPEPLKQNLAGWWSRRISLEHRLVYRVSGKGADQVLEIAQCRFHY